MPQHLGGSESPAPPVPLEPAESAPGLAVNTDWLVILSSNYQW